MAARSDTLLDLYEAVCNHLLDRGISDLPTVEKFDVIIGLGFYKGYRTFDRLLEFALLSL